MEFDQIELFCTGLLTIKLGEALKVYHAYWEMTDDCGDPGEECMQLISNANYGAVATINTKGLADVGGTIANLGNMVDGNIDSYATVVKPVSAATDTEIKVTFNTIRKNQEVGFILTGVTGLTNVQLIGILQVKAYKDGKEITDNTTEGGLLGLKLAGSGQRKYISITPTSDFNELHLIIGKGVGALSNYLINGVYLRPDYDGDGVMDCITDELSTEIINLYVEPEDICIGDEAAFRVDGGEEGVTYTLEFIDKHDGAKSYKGDVTINSSGYLEFTDPGFFVSLPVGEYDVSVLHSGQIILNRIGSLIIHPQETTWKKDALSTDWNDWNNWDRGVPWECTNVIIPTGATKYPVLNEKVYCHHIHFEPGAELIGQEHLNYQGKAFVDVDVQSGAYQLFSAPLKNMLTGDMFVYQGDLAVWNEMRKETDESGFHTNYFKELNEEVGDLALAYGEQRTKPVIYQRFYSKMVENTALTRAVSMDDPAIMKQPNWSRTFNAVSTVYELGQGFAMRAGEADGANTSTYSFHFPKSHTKYHYYDLEGSALKAETFTRKSVGRLMVENSMPSTITLTQLDNSDMFLFGNPFMAHINIQKFLDANKESIEAAYVYVNNDYQTIQANGISSRADATRQLAPMQAMFVQTKTSGKSALIRLSNEMLEQGMSAITASARKSAFSPLYLSARTNQQTASCVVLSESAIRSGNYPANVSLLLDNEANPEVAVYTVADGKALSIHYLSSAGRIPVGFYLNNTGDVRLSFEAHGSVWDGWRLVDSETGQAYRLIDSVTLKNVSPGSARFYLEKEN